MPAIHLSRKRQLTLPSQIAKQAGIAPNDTLWIEVVGEEIRIRKAPADPVQHFAGILAPYFASSEAADTWVKEERDAWSSH